MTGRVLLLGHGAQGRAALHDLVSGTGDLQVTVADAESTLGEQIPGYPASRVRATRLDADDEAASRR